jgi:hypothetical protein
MFLCKKLHKKTFKISRKISKISILFDEIIKGEPGILSYIVHRISNKLNHI